MPLYGLQLMKKVIGELFPELKDIGFTDSRVCAPVESPNISAYILTLIPAVLVHRQY